jgi:hypothetical protein
LSSSPWIRGAPQQGFTPCCCQRPKAVHEKTEAARLQLSFGDETALIYLGQVVTLTLKRTASYTHATSARCRRTAYPAPIQMMATQPRETVIW